MGNCCRGAPPPPRDSNSGGGANVKLLAAPTTLTVDVSTARTPQQISNQITLENGKFRYLGQQNQPKNDQIVKETASTPSTNRKTSSLQGHRPSKRPSARKFFEICGRLSLNLVFSLLAVTLIALYSYDSRSDGDLSFKKGDLMILLDDQNADWWYVKHVASDSTGYVPRNFVAIQKSTESEEWFAGKIGRSIAEKLVNNPDLPRGTFLIRDRETERHGVGQNTNNEYALTIKDYDSVKHYKIKRLEDGGFYITTRKTFSSLEELVHYYSNAADGLCHVLRTPCPRHAPLRPDLSHQTNKNWEIDRSELEFYNKIGQGNFGEVWYGKFQKTYDVAVKTLRQGSMSREAFLEEASIMKRCVHPNLVKLYAVCTKQEPLCIVTEYMCNGSLLEFLRNSEGRSLGFKALIDFCTQVANGMRFLENHRMVHRDLAARNILVGDKVGDIPIIKVADFGLARVITDDEYNARTGAKFPIKWTAPEAALYATFTIKSDVWSYGILLYEIITKGQVPYPGMQNREVVEQVEMGYRMPQPRDCPPPVYEMMLKCWDTVPDNRPTFEHLYHYFDDYFVSAQSSYAPSEN